MSNMSLNYHFYVLVREKAISDSEYSFDKKNRRKLNSCIYSTYESVNLILHILTYLKLLNSTIKFTRLLCIWYCVRLFFYEHTFLDKPVY